MPRIRISEPANDAEKALVAWSMIAERYDEHVPTPKGIAPDLNVYVNGDLVMRSAGEYRTMLREITRRFPDWHNEIIQEFGDENGQCTVWRSRGHADDGSKTEMDLHGVTLLESEAGVVHTAKFFFEAGSPKTNYAAPLGLRVVHNEGI